MLFFFHPTISQIRSSPNRVVLVLLVILFVCCTFPSTSDAYPLSSSSFSILDQDNIIDEHDDILNFRNRRRVMLDEQLWTDGDLDRHNRGTGYYIVRQGEFLVFIPDSKHHFTKNLRPYIGRRR
jgi:hypothetical protein